VAVEPRDYLANRTPVPTGTLTQLLLEAVDRFGDRPAHLTIQEDGFRAFSYREVLTKAREVSGGLSVLEVERGDRVAILSDGRPEWSQTDFGALCSGVPLVPVHSTLTVSQIAYILADSGARALFASDREQLEKGLAARSALGEPLPVVVFDPPGEMPEGVISWSDFLDRGRQALEGTSEEAFRRAALAADPHEPATILYTSGTTGDPKGVVLTHNNIFSNVKATEQVVPLD
jgi:long-chain acyl-CoA synthetase